MHHLLLRDQVDGGVGAIAIALGPDLLHRLHVVVFVAPEIDDSLLVIVGRIGRVLLLRLGRRHREEDARPVLREDKRPAVAHHELLAEAGGIRAGQFRGSALAVPAIQLPLRLFGRGIVAVAEEHQLRLVLVPGEPRVLALAPQQRGRSRGIAGLCREDAVLRRIARADRENDLPPIVGEHELGDVGEGALAAVGQRAQHQVAAELRPHAAPRAARRDAPAPAASALLVVPLRRIRGFTARCGPIRPLLQIGQQTGRLLGQREALHTLDARGLAAGQIQDHHAVFRRGLLVLLRLAGCRLGREGGKDQRLVVGRECQRKSACFGRRTFFTGSRRNRRRTGARRLALFLTGGQVADDHLAIAFLRELPVGQIFPVVRKLLSDDGSPSVVILVGQGPLVLSDPRSQQQGRGNHQPQRDARVRHEVRIPREEYLLRAAALIKRRPRVPTRRWTSSTHCGNLTIPGNLDWD